MTAATPGQAEREALEATFRRTYALHPNDFRAKFEQARDAVMGAADAYAQAVAQADLLSRLRTVLLDLRTNPTEARIQALHLLDAAASPPAAVQSAPDDALFWAWMDAYVDEPHNAQYEVPDMQRAFEGGMQAARDQPALAAQDAQPAPGGPVDALAAALADTRPPVIIRGIAEPHTLARPYDLAVQLLAALGTQPEPQPAPGLAADLEAQVRLWRHEAELDAYDDGDGDDDGAAAAAIAQCALELAQIIAKHAGAAPAAPELAAAMAQVDITRAAAANSIRELRQEARQYRDALSKLKAILLLGEDDPARARREALAAMPLGLPS